MVCAVTHTNPSVSASSASATSTTFIRSAPTCLVDAGSADSAHFTRSYASISAVFPPVPGCAATWQHLGWAGHLPGSPGDSGWRLWEALRSPWRRRLSFRRLVDRHRTHELVDLVQVNSQGARAEPVSS